MSLGERPRGSARPTPNEHYNSLPRTSIEGALGLSGAPGPIGPRDWPELCIASGSFCATMAQDRSSCTEDPPLVRNPT